VDDSEFSPQSQSIFLLQDDISDNVLIKKAVRIVERLWSNLEFVTKTYGTVLNKIGSHYKMSPLADASDLKKIHEKLVPIHLVSGIPGSESETTYMVCYTKIRQININQNV
jgi:DNA-binding Lrp family transcriptional regulator